ncbi:MAG: hypothetical protein ACYC3S_13650 [Chloroflexota bacterium]
MPASLAHAEVQGFALPRDNRWLGEHLAYVWDRFFADTPCANPVDIAFAKRWKARLGLISLSEEERTSIIRLNALLSHPDVPECLTTITVAHELVHYSHGFGSTLPRKFGHPHQDDVVEKEILGRGLSRTYGEYLGWIDHHWDQFYYSQTTPPRRLWLPRRSGQPVKVIGEGMQAQGAASVIRLRRVAGAGSQLSQRG